MRVAFSTQVHCVGIREDLFIAIGRTEEADNLLARFDSDTSDLKILSGGTVEELQGCIESEELLDRDRHEVGLVDELQQVAGHRQSRPSRR